MTIATSILPELPYLRRFARSVCGGQQSGDAYVKAVLEALIEDPSTFPRGLTLRVALYQTFLKVWNSIKLNGTHERYPSVSGRMDVDQRLETITPVARQAFLLVAVEGFAPDDAAKILNKSIQDTQHDLEAAGREIAEQVATDVLIIEDEPLIAMDIEHLVSALGHTVTSVARTKTEALAAIHQKRPGLVLADIQLADGSSGLDAVNDILGEFEVPVIFITAFPEKLLTGERPEPAFLISKPFQHAQVKAIISQALFFDIKSHRKPLSAAL